MASATPNDTAVAPPGGMANATVATAPTNATVATPPAPLPRRRAARVVGALYTNVHGHPCLWDGANLEYLCPHPGCGARFAKSGNLRTHVRTHTGERPYACDHPGCGARFTTSGGLRTHVFTHTGEKPYACDHPGCGARFAQSGGLKTHVRTHTGEKPYACPDPRCDDRFAQRGNMLTHWRCTHGPEAGRRRKRQERRVELALMGAGYARFQEGGTDVPPPVGMYRREFHVDYRCVDGAGAEHQYHRIDFVVGVPGGYALIEVDEYQHRFGYEAEASCDMRRMNRIMTSWRIGNASVPNLAWIRYNPHCFEVDGVPQRRRVPKRDREAWLVARLARGATEPLTIEYAYYDYDTVGPDALTPRPVLRPGYHPMYAAVATLAAPERFEATLAESTGDGGVEDTDEDEDSLSCGLLASPATNSTLASPATNSTLASPATNSTSTASGSPPSPSDDDEPLWFAC